MDRIVDFLAEEEKQEELKAKRAEGAEERHTALLPQLTAEMKSRCAELKEDRRSLIKAELKSKFELKVANMLGEMDSEYGIVTFGPDVPAATQKLFCW
jgi:TATA-binding protein-associated factor Taf7